MTGYRQRDTTEMTWEANRVRADAEIRILQLNLRNGVLGKMDEVFQAGLARGEILNLAMSRAEVEAFAFDALMSVQHDAPKLVKPNGK